MVERRKKIIRAENIFRAYSRLPSQKSISPYAYERNYVYLTIYLLAGGEGWSLCDRIDCDMYERE